MNFIISVYRFCYQRADATQADKIFAVILVTAIFLSPLLLITLIES